MEKIKIIETKNIPKRAKFGGKTSIVPEILKQIPKGKTAELPNNQPYKIASIRSYIEKQHKNKKLLQYTVQQRTTIKDNLKTITLYITHEGKE